MGPGQCSRASRRRRGGHGGGEAGAWVPPYLWRRQRRKEWEGRNPRTRSGGFIGGAGAVPWPRWPCAPSGFHHERQRGRKKKRRETGRWQVGSAGDRLAMGKILPGR